MPKLRLLETLRHAKLSPKSTLYILGGADLQILEKAPADRGEFRSRGIAAIIPAIMAFIGGIVFVEIVTGNILVAVIGGCFWGFVVLLLDVSLLAAMANSRGWFKALAVCARSIISIAAALMVAGVMLLGIYHQDVDAQVVEDQTVAAQQYYDNVVLPQYAADRSAAQATLDTKQALIDAANAEVAALEVKVTDGKREVSCELYGVSDTGNCPPTSGQAGAGENYGVAVDNLSIDQENLTAAQAKARELQDSFKPEMDAARATLARTEQGAATDKDAALQRLLADRGLIPRWNALETLRHESPIVNFWSWVLEILLVALDLMAVITAVFGRTPDYARAVKALSVRTDTQAAAEEAEARHILAQREREIRIEEAPLIIKAAQADAEVAEIESRYAILAEQRSRALKAEQALTADEEAERTTKAEQAKADAAIADAELAARIAAIQDPVAAARAKAEIARIELDQLEAELSIARFRAELDKLTSGSN